MSAVPRSRWLTLLVAALLCVLGGANRGRVPAHEREGSRTADEPAALRTRGAAVDRERADEDRASVLAPDDEALVSVVRLATATAHVHELAAPVQPVPTASRRHAAASPRGPPSLESSV